MEIRIILPLHSNTKIPNYKNSLYTMTVLFVSRTPGGPTTKILSTIDHDLIIIKFKEFEFLKY